MISIYNIVDEINKELKPLFDACQISNSKLSGIAETLFTDKISQPVINEQHVGIDDTHHLILYHKLSSLSSTLAANLATGRSLGMIVNTYNIGMIVFLDNGKTNLYPDELLQYIQANFPTQVKVQPYDSILLRFVSVILDSRLILTQEYNSNEQFKLEANQYFFRINYTAELRFDKKCFSKCP